MKTKTDFFQHVFRYRRGKYEIHKVPQKEITNTLNAIYHMAKVTMVTPRFTANQVDLDLHFTLNFRYIKHNSHDQTTASIFMNAQI